MEQYALEIVSMPDCFLLSFVHRGLAFVTTYYEVGCLVREKTS
jgi:hypothetical protein